MGGVRFDEAEVPVWILFIVATSDPEAKLFVADLNTISVILRDRFLNIESFSAKTVGHEMRETSSPETWINLMFLIGVGGKSIGAKFQVR